MRKTLFVSACVIAMSTGGAFAQNQPAPGASGQGEVGQGAPRHATGHMTNRHKGTTTGSSTRRHHTANPSSQGNTAPGAGGKY